jgi:hypothetical protein
MKGSVDYAWVWAIVIVVGLVVFWKPLMKGIQDVTGGSKRKQMIAEGKVRFYDTEVWGGKGSYKSCAMCHASDFKPDPGKKIDMADYRPGKPYSLKGSSSRLMTVMGDDAVFNAINDCLGLPSRMNVGKVSSSSKFIPPLMAYVKSQD